MTKSSGERTARLEIVVSENELKAIDDYRFRLRLPNRSAAIRALLQAGMKKAADDDK